MASQTRELWVNDTLTRWAEGGSVVVEAKLPFLALGIVWCSI